MAESPLVEDARLVAHSLVAMPPPTTLIFRVDCSPSTTTMQIPNDSPLRRGGPLLASLISALWMIVCAHAAAADNSTFVTFESAQVRPLILSPDGTQLFAVNTPDNRLETFRVGDGLTHAGAV